MNAPLYLLDTEKYNIFKLDQLRFWFAKISL